MATPTVRPRLLTPAFITASVAALAYFVADGMTIPIYPVYVHGPLLADDIALGLVFGAFSLTALVLRPWAGATVDRRGRRPLMIGGALLFAIGMLAHLVANSVPLLIAARLILGAAEACFFVAFFTLVSDLAPESRRGEAINYSSLAVYGGIAFGPFLGELVLGEDRFAAAWIVAAGLAGVAALLCLRVPETRPEREEGSTDDPVRTGLRRYFHPAALVPGLVVLAGTWGMGGFFAFAKRYAEQLGLDAAAPLFLLYAGIVIGLRGLFPWIPDRFGARRVSTFGMACTTAGLAVIGLVPGIAGLFSGAALFAFGVTFLVPGLFVVAVEGIPPRERGTLLGTMSAFLDLSFGLGPMALGLVAAGAGYPATFLVSAAVASAGLVLLLATARRRRRPATPELTRV